MRKFAWIFMAAMTVAGFSACSNSDDDVLPGMEGGNGGGTGTGSSVVLTDTIYQFNNIEAQYTPINELCPGWTHEIVSPADDDRTWQSKTFTNSSTGVTEKYIQATAHDSSDKNAGKTYELWMISPALNVKDAANKVFSFYSEGAYWQSTSSLEVYILNEPKSTASSKEKLNPVLATSTNPGGNFKGWVASGDISLEGKGDVVYIGFRYQAQGGKSNSTTYCIDDFAFGRAQVEHYMGESGGDTPEPTPEVDWTKAISVADCYAVAEGSDCIVKGYIVGTLKATSAGGASSFDSFEDAQSQNCVEWNGASEYTGYNVVFIADDANETDGSKCLLVRIGDITEFKNEAKLEGHPERIGMMIYAQGVRKNNIYGLPGVRDLNAYKVGE
ncbi:choice-of-anchor J domain-containing protein [Barnesiella viscericola]|uniref:choice-of-anchor J domain-containing protein n=1 Tax=Barnesiella viscericola TaxID=397865 RepID=UPI00255BE0E8|nr:choice-of-anchor J domain-containing protein [Barnesiella viscericola]